jgi:hypothetical protein
LNKVYRPISWYYRGVGGYKKYNIYELLLVASWNSQKKCKSFIYDIETLCWKNSSAFPGTFRDIDMEIFQHSKWNYIRSIERKNY